jgi:hypothetical protein
VKYAVFTNDVGPNEYSRFCDVNAPDLSAAKQTAKLRFNPRKFQPLAAGVQILVLPHSRKDLWPDGQTGKIPQDARPFIVGAM